MTELFAGLLVSCPNDGGMFYLDGQQAIKLDGLDTTGICQVEGRVLRGLQPDRVYIIDGVAPGHVLNEIFVPDVHDVLLCGEVHYVVATQGNEIIKLDHSGKELQRFIFPGEPDSWHVNCLVQFGKRTLFSAFGDCREHRAYKVEPVGSGFVQDLHTGERLIIGLSQPHSMVEAGANLLLANSYEGEIHEYNGAFKLLRKKNVGGYTRGILIDGDTIYVGLSASRNRDDGAMCATLLALDAFSWEELGRISLPVNEIYGILRPKAVDLPTVLAVNASMASHRLANQSDELKRNLNDTVSRLQGQVHEQAGQLEGLVEELRAKAVFTDELVRQLDQKQSEWMQREERLRGELQAKSAFADELVRQLDLKQDELRQREERLQVELQARIAFSDELARQLGQKQDELRQHQAHARDVLQAKITFAEDLVRQLDQKQVELRECEERLRSELHTKSAFADELVRQLDQKQFELRQREEQLQAELHTKSAFVGELVRQLDQKQDELRRCEERLQSELQAKIAYSDELSRQLDQKRDESRRREEQLRDELRCKDNLVDELAQRLDQTQIELQQAAGRLRDLAVELHTKELRMDDLNEQLDKAQVELQRQEDLSEEVREQLRVRGVRVAELDQQVGGLREALAECEAQLKLLRASRSWRMTAPLRSCNAFICRLVAARKRAIAAIRHVFQDASSRRKYTIIARRLGPLGAMRQMVRFVRRGGPSPEPGLLLSGRPVFDLRTTDGQSVVVLSTMHCRYVAELIVSALERVGIAARIIYDVPKGAYDDVPHFVICPQMFERLPGLYVSFQMEQSVSSRWFTPDYLRKLENSFAIFDYSLENIARLVSMGLYAKQFYYLPIGYLPGYKSGESAVLGTEKEYDVLFYGDIENERRRACIAELEKVCKVKVVNNLFGTAMTDELRRARIVVNIHYYPGALLETTRLWECLSLGCLVVSERSTDMDQHEDLWQLIDFVDEGDFSGMAARVSHWLANESAWHERTVGIAAQAASIFNRFDYYFYRFLLASGNLSFEEFWRLIGSKYPLPSDMLCLNLPEYTDRAASFDKDNRYGFHKFPGLRHSKGWMGCALSYKYMIRLAMAKGLPRITICEDDVEFPANFGDSWPKISQYLADNAGRWHIFSGVMADLHDDVRIYGSNEYAGYEIVTMSKLISMVFNVYDQSSYEILANWNEADDDVTTNTIDRYLERKNSIRVLVTCPFLVGHKEELYSTLWNAQNAIYTDLISKSEALVRKKIDEWHSKRSRWRRRVLGRPDT